LRWNYFRHLSDIIYEPFLKFLSFSFFKTKNKKSKIALRIIHATYFHNCIFCRYHKLLQLVNFVYWKWVEENIKEECTVRERDIHINQNIKGGDGLLLLSHERKMTTQKRVIMQPKRYKLKISFLFYAWTVKAEFVQAQL
jgi:hypothetical protein